MRWAVHEALRCMFRNIVRCNSLVRVEKVQEELLALPRVAQEAARSAAGR